MGLFDINNPTQWADFVLDFMRENMPEWGTPDVYYAGSPYDAQWFTPCFEHIECIDRTNPDFPYVSGSMVRDMMTIGDRRWKILFIRLTIIYRRIFKPQKGEL